jgi:signal transduction histidine kinase
VIERRPVDLDRVLREAWASHAAEAARRGVTVEWRLAEKIDLLSDPGKLAIVFSNLLGSAVAYVNDQGRISVSAEIDDTACRAAIASTGCTLRTEDAALVFDRFWRGDPSRFVAGAHCGLGLPLCRQLVALHGGSISVACVEGGEFVVVVELPLGASQAAVDGES